ncbi:hypothetical protein KQI41_13605 [Tissierella pigra]|uniref:Uncharacterized protein n=1 Tax=Tissierella pigra TaxID=2607614 RepID=A0A6N7XT68_9FIRM|nr:hypothetical protein [Tissierella pigra]MBU5427422.1 hypothetical protein [Tissierella pigra]MSU00967.1 hypothetical protein [Tissierella pigra]
MKDKHKFNQPYYTEPVNKTNSNISNDNEDWKKTGFYRNSEDFPPRGSFISIPEDVLLGTNGNLLDSIVKDKDETIGSDLYKETKNNK